MDREGRVTGMNVGQPEKSRNPTRPTEPPGMRERLSAGGTSTHQRFSASALRTHLIMCTGCGCRITAGFIKIGPFYVDYPIGPSNSGWRGNFAELFSHPKIFVVTKLSCRIRDNSSISLIFTRYGIFNILFFDLTLNPAVKLFGFRMAYAT